MRRIEMSVLDCTQLYPHQLNRHTKGLITVLGEFQPGLKFHSAHWAEILLRLHAQFQPGAKRKFLWESLLRCENTIDTHARAPLSAQAVLPCIEVGDTTVVRRIEMSVLDCTQLYLHQLNRHTKGLIIVHGEFWARAEISLRPLGWNIVAITCSISARAQNVNFCEKVYWGAITQ